MLQHTVEHPRSVSLIQYLTKCDIWSQCLLINLSYGFQWWQKKMFSQNIMMSQWSWPLGYKMSSLHHLLLLDISVKFIVMAKNVFCVVRVTLAFDIQFIIHSSSSSGCLCQLLWNSVQLVLRKRVYENWADVRSQWPWPSTKIWSWVLRSLHLYNFIFK